MMNNNKILLDVFKKFKEKYDNNEFVINSDNSKMLELINHTMELNPAQSFIDLTNTIGRKTSEYVNRELQWYLSQSLNINDIPGKVPKIWKSICSTNNEINSNYGYLIFSEKNFNQYLNCKKQLEADKNTRRAIMIYNRPSIQVDYKKDGMSDFICTLANQFLIRNNKLISIYSMRSNDAIFGFFNDFYWACFVYDLLYKELLNIYPELQYGSIFWNANSFHLYERHFKLLKNI